MQDQIYSTGDLNVWQLP